MSKAMRLDQVPAGAEVRMLGFVRCRRCGLRLTEMGLTPGTTIKVLQASRGQPILLRVRGSQLAIDRETAQKIEVEQIEEGMQIQNQGRRAWRRAGGHRRAGGRGGRRGWKHWRGPGERLSESEGDQRDRW